MSTPLKQTSCLAILSGGLDSSVALALTQLTCPVVEAVTFDYNQRAAAREITAARALCAHLNVPHRVLRLPWLEDAECSLLNPQQRLPRLSQNDLDSLEKTRETASSVWVPNRNGVFIAVAASIAEALGVNRLCVGFNREEAATFPDNSSAYLRSVNQSLKFSTLNKVQVICPTLNMNKIEILHEAVRLELPLSQLWSCYEGGASPCGSCESCLRRQRAAEVLGLTQPRGTTGFIPQESLPS